MRGEILTLLESLESAGPGNALSAITWPGLFDYASILAFIHGTSVMLIILRARTRTARGGKGAALACALKELLYWRYFALVAVK